VVRDKKEKETKVVWDKSLDIYVGFLLIHSG
jgi:hypothetical protein